MTGTNGGTISGTTGDNRDMRTRDGGGTMGGYISPIYSPCPVDVSRPAPRVPADPVRQRMLLRVAVLAEARERLRKGVG